MEAAVNETGSSYRNVQGNLIISTLVVTLKSRYVLKTHISDHAFCLSLHETVHTAAGGGSKITLKQKIPLISLYR